MSCPDTGASGGTKAKQRICEYGKLEGKKIC